MTYFRNLGAALRGRIDLIGDADHVTIPRPRFYELLSREQRAAAAERRAAGQRKANEARKAAAAARAADTPF